MRASSNTDLAALAAAVVGPLCVLVLLRGALSWSEARTAAERTDPTSDVLDRGLAPWRSVESGQLSADELMAEMEVRLRGEPQVVILGNSHAGTTEPAVLADALGLRARDVVSLTIPYSAGAHWRGVVEHGIVARGHRPRAALVLAPMVEALLPAPTWRPGPLSALWSARSRLQRQILTAVREVPVAWLLPRRPDGSPTNALKSVNATFDPDGVDPTLHAAASPVAEGVRVDATLLHSPESILPVDDSEIPRLAQLLRSADIAMWYVAPPLPPGGSPAWDPIPAGERRRFQEVVEAEGGVFLDLREVPMSEAHFHHRLNHATKDGMRRTTAVVVESLRAVGALGPLPPEDLLAPGRLVDGTWVVRPPPTAVDGPPPAVPAVPLAVEGDVGVFRLPKRAAQLADDATEQVTPRWARCSPFLVTEDGVPLPAHHVGPREVAGRPGRVAHAGAVVRFSTTDGQPPDANGRSYALALDPTRDCDGGRWVYPGDAVTVTRSGPLSGPASSLRLEIHASEGADLAVTVSIDDRPVRSWSPSAADLGHPVALPLSAPPGARLAVRVENAGTGFALWTRAELLP